MTTAHTFRVPFWRLFLTAMIYAQVLTQVPVLLLAVLTHAQGTMADVAESSIIVSCGTGATVLWVLVPNCRTLDVRVTADELTCSNVYTNRATVPWESVTRVQRFHIPGIPFLLVTSSHVRSRMLLPLFLGRFPEFVQAVEQYAGVNHILYQAVWPQVERQG